MKGKGWTLVELLVIVGIILTLINLTIAVVGIASDIRSKVKCMNNLHQLYLVSKLYEQDFGVPPFDFKELITYKPEVRSLLICPKDPFQGYAAGGYSHVCSDPQSERCKKFLKTYIPHSYPPQYWISYWALKGRIKLIGRPEWIAKSIEKFKIEKYYFICSYHELGVTLDGRVERLADEYLPPSGRRGQGK